MDGRFGFDFLADGRLVYQTVEEGRLELAIMKSDGTGRQLLTEDVRGELYPTVTPDGRILYTDGWFSESRPLLRLMDLEGNDSPALAEVEAERYVGAALSPDGSWAVIAKSSGLWRVPLNGDTPTQLTDFFALLPTVSEDGSRLAFYIAEIDRPLRIGVLSLGNGELTEYPVPATISNSSSLLRWAGDDTLFLNSMPGDRSNLWRYPLDGSEPERLTDFTDEYLYWFEYSPDGETMVVSIGKFVRDAVLITDFR